LSGNSAATLKALRRFVLAVYVMGVLGAAADLLLTAHVDGALQLIPLALLGAGAAVLLWHLARGGREGIRLHQAMMILFIVSGLVGTFLHLRANIEFELEMYPGLAGLELWWKAVQGASPPSLAPGAMIALGLLGLIYAYRHPASRSGRNARHGAI
jgi:hypothetical protein